MPATYAHWRFGVDCIETLPENLKKAVLENRDLFDLGVHGPDIFFYDLLHKDVSEFGFAMHKIPARQFFERCKDVFNSHEEKEQMLAYMLGFLSHFTLDSLCHSYVERKKEVSGVSHNRIESEWDRHTIELDGRVTHLVDRAESLKPNKNNARIISYFFSFNERVILRATRCQRFIVYALNCISVRKEILLKKFLTKIGMENYADLLIGFQEYTPCKDSNLRLDKLKNKALKQYPKLMNNFIAYLYDDKKLSPYFKHGFDEWDDYKDIKVLDYMQELKYKV